MSEKKYSVGIYARLSVDSHDAKNASIETQIEIAKSYIRNHKELVSQNAIQIWENQE